MNALAAAIIALGAVGCSKADDKPEPSNPEATVTQQFDAAADRLESMADAGWVVSRNAENGPAHEGDSLIWTGMAMGDLDCSRGRAQEVALQAMLEETGGKIYRHPTIKDQASMDGALGLYYGIARRVARCGDSWSAPLQASPDFWKNPLNSPSGANLPAEFTYVRDLLGFKMGALPEPKPVRKGLLEAQIAAWAAGVSGSQAACYRVHLGLLGLQTIEALGGSVSDNGRNAFCSVTKGMGLRTVDLWCGRTDLRDWITNFEYDKWEFSHQRCNAWETPDGNGLITPGLDLIVAIRAAYQLPGASP